MFDSVEKVQKSLADHDYICDKKIATVVFLAAKLEKSVLVEGPAGVGKTELAKTVAAATGRNLIRLQCYEGLDEAKALYEWEYSKQLLYTQILKEKFTEAMAGAGSIREAAERIGREDSVFFSDNFLVARPLLAAITADESPPLLIDEIDQSDPAFEAFLLEVLQGVQVPAPELGTGAGSRQTGVTHVIAEVEALVINPDGVVDQRDARQPLPIARDERQAGCDESSNPVEVDAAFRRAQGLHLDHGR